MNEVNNQYRSTEEENERQKLEELELRYTKLYEWAKDQEFVTVFRAEGDTNWKAERSLSPQLIGTWYTDRYAMIKSRYKPEIECASGNPAIVFALIIPKSSLDDREAIDKGMWQINIFNAELLAGRQRINDPAEAARANLENYLDQFPFVKEYKKLKEKYK